jgi:hypothetical protein
MINFREYREILKPKLDLKNSSDESLSANVKLAKKVNFGVSTVGILAIITPLLVQCGIVFMVAASMVLSIAATLSVVLDIYAELHKEEINNRT